MNVILALIIAIASILPSVASRAQPTNAPANVSMTGYTGNAGYAVPSLGASDAIATELGR